MTQPIDYYHSRSDWLCPITGKEVNFVFTDHSRPGCYNACAECSADKRTLGERLADLNSARGKTKGRKRAR